MNKDLKKEKSDFDCRAISDDFLQCFMSDKNGKKGKLYPFLELVKKHEELMFCFRGNGNSESIIIYRNNQSMFRITKNTVYFNPNYLRYSTNWKDYLKQLCDFGYGKGKKIELDKVNQSKKGYSCSFKTSPVFSANIDKDYLDNLDDIYILMSKIFDEYFCPNKFLCDQFLLENNIVKNNKKEHTEKIRQQQLFQIFKEQKNGYFFYDLEFQQKHKSKEYLKEDIEKKINNKPDMQAVRFDENGDVKAIVFVEVKSTAEAYYGNSGLDKHIKSMRNYRPELLESRRREALLLLDQYEKLGIITLEKKLNPDVFEKLPLEILLVFTDDAIKKWKEDTSSTILKIKQKQPNNIGNVKKITSKEDALVVTL